MVMTKIYSLAANAAIPVTVRINRPCHHLVKTNATSPQAFSSSPLQYPASNS
jgi:hypothetical protein